MAYSQAAGLPAIHGLYATISALIAYAIFGPSRIMALGPDSSLAALIAATILPLAAGNADLALSLAEILAILSDVLCIVAGLAKLGFITELISKPIRYGYKVDSNQELVSLGFANVVTGLFQGFSVSGGASRTPVAEQAGAKTQVAGLVGALLGMLLSLFAPTMLKNLPHAALSAVVICACLGQIEIVQLVRLYQLRRSELLFSIVCFLGVVLLGAIEGIFIAVGLALLAFIWRAWRPYDAVLGRVDSLKGYHDISRHPEARRIPGLVLFRWDAPLFFANAAVFEEHVLQAIATAPTPTKWVVVAAEPVTDIDITAADMLADLDQKLHQADMDICFAEMKGPVKDILKRYGLFDSLGTENFFPTIGQAVDRYLEIHKVSWRDWDEPV